MEEESAGMDEIQVNKGIDIEEIEDAISAADAALMYLRIAGDRLRSARNWGIYDLIEGKGMTGFFKHRKMRQAAAEIDNARFALRKLSDELKDVELILSMDEGVQNLSSNFLAFADLFYDCFIVDIFAQSRIRQGQRMCEEAITTVTKIKFELQKRLERLKDMSDW